MSLQKKTQFHLFSRFEYCSTGSTVSLKNESVAAILHNNKKGSEKHYMLLNSTPLRIYGI